MERWLQGRAPWAVHPVNRNVSANRGASILSEQDCVVQFARFLNDAAVSWKEMHFELAPGQWMFRRETDAAKNACVRLPRFDMVVLDHDCLAAHEFPTHRGGLCVRRDRRVQVGRGLVAMGRRRQPPFEGEGANLGSNRRFVRCSTCHRPRRVGGGPLRSGRCCRGMRPLLRVGRIGVRRSGRPYRADLRAGRARSSVVVRRVTRPVPSAVRHACPHPQDGFRLVAVSADAVELRRCQFVTAGEVKRSCHAWHSVDRDSIMPKRWSPESGSRAVDRCMFIRLGSPHLVPWIRP